MNSLSVNKGFNNENIQFNDNLNVTLSNNDSLILTVTDISKSVTIDVTNESNCRLYLDFAFENETVDFNVNLASNAKLEFVIVQNNNNDNNFTTTLASSAVCNMFFIDFSNKSTNTFNTSLTNEYAEFNIKTANINLTNTESKFMIDTKHLSKATLSNALSRSVVLSGGKYINNTIGFIEKGCSLSKCHQDTKAVVLGKNAMAQCDPVLLIDEYDVEASHAAAVGQINEDELYYMQSRGLSYEQCLALLINGFLISVTDGISDEDIKEGLSNKIHTILNV